MTLFQLLLRRADGFQLISCLADRRKVYKTEATGVDDLDFIKRKAASVVEAAKATFGEVEALQLDLTGYAEGTHQGPMIAAIKAVFEYL